MKRLVMHWTGGGPHPSDADVEHYHIIVDRKGVLSRGRHSISDNVFTGDDDYAAHTRRCNTGSIGLALCGMGDARERPFKPGPYPLTRQQWNKGIIAAANLCRRYRIEPNPKTLLMHCEVERVFGIDQTGRWDISRLVFDRNIWSDMTPGDEMRARVKILLQQE